MSETAKNTELGKYLDKLFAWRKVEFNNLVYMTKRFKEQFKELFGEEELNTFFDIRSYFDKLSKDAYEKGEVTFSNTKFCFLQEITFHIGTLDAIDNIIKDFTKCFNIYENENSNCEIDSQKYSTKDIDIRNYNTIPEKIYFILGGINECYSKEVQEKCIKLCLDSFLESVDESEIVRAEEGFIVNTPIQNIPNILNKLIQNNIGIYGIIPIK